MPCSVSSRQRTLPICHQEICEPGGNQTMVADAGAEAKELNVEVTICIVDESGNLLFSAESGCRPAQHHRFAQKKARHAALYKSPSKDGAEALKKAISMSSLFRTFPQPGLDCLSRWTARPSVVLLPVAPI